MTTLIEVFMIHAAPLPMKRSSPDAFNFGAQQPTNGGGGQGNGSFTTAERTDQGGASRPNNGARVRRNNHSQEKRVLHKWTEEEHEVLLEAAKKSPNACYQMYLNLTGNFKRGPWTREEDESLRLLTATEHYSGRWKVISEILHRSSSSCYSRWQARFKPDVKTGRWTEEEDLALIQGVEEYGRDWSRIVQNIPGRSSKHALLRYDKFLAPKIKRDVWTAKEDELLMKGCEEYGRNWTKIAESIPGRTTVQLQLRYDSHLGRKINKGRWTREENEQLLKLVKKYGNNWTQISRELTTRSNVQALIRYKYMCQKEDAEPMPDDQ
ncbi:hypothetical protein K493DRAFT_405163 [Basidiobolus meristosporus CBS 931.73]|uniref:Homeodomain-like protein n=1 Tax=Basidiobolus meristosporus CBS 931.73 TaxID=1314790 RepID=A0A1Y1YXN1_9FUNG|nr:hypothetical protein K493DRAFT_405163 [Basidiobolus meristosporus CBS 931.73]|eukprot:ORY02783.1 hypothetical protein K493DRAFT_405163 [Basidiobolus meristosporus CBS 931.73]